MVRMLPLVGGPPTERGDLPESTYFGILFQAKDLLEGIHSLRAFSQLPEGDDGHFLHMNVLFILRGTLPPHGATERLQALFCDENQTIHAVLHAGGGQETRGTGEREDTEKPKAIDPCERQSEQKCDMANGFCEKLMWTERSETGGADPPPDADWRSCPNTPAWRRIEHE